MALTINPAVCRTRARHVRTIMLHTFGAILGALATLMCIAVVYVGLRTAVGPGIAWYVLSVAVAGGIARDFGLPATVTPNRRVQVPEWYRDAFSQEATAAIFGALLGATVLTYFSMSASISVFAMAPFLGPAVGISAVVLYGTSRSLVLLAVSRVSSVDNVARVARLSVRKYKALHVVNGIVSMLLIACVGVTIVW
jgi:hypothetical protein